MNKKLLIVLLVLLGLIAGVCIYKIVTIQSGYNEGKSIYQEIKEDSTPSKKSDLDNLNWKKLQKKYPHIVGWIKQKGSVIDYPIVQGTDNDFYLTHAANDEWSVYGAPFVHYDIKEPFKTNLTIIYGHNMNDGSMFASLYNYILDNTYIKKHKEFILYTPEQVYKAKVVGYGEIDASVSAYYNYLTTDSKKYSKKISSYLIDGVNIEKSDKLIMLSTCTPYGYDGSPIRVVVWCKLSEVEE